MEKQIRKPGRKGQEDDNARHVFARELLNPQAQYQPSIVLHGRSLAAITSDPSEEAIRVLVTHLFDEVIFPSLSAETREEFFTGLNRIWHTFHTTVSALSVLFRTTPAGIAIVKRVELDGVNLAADAAKISGADAAEEIEFCERTYQSAVRITRRFSGLPDAKDVETDRKFCGKFNFGSSMHALGACMITAIADDKARATAVGITGAFELFRMGAVEAYVAARSALELRKPEETVSDDPLPFDDEDVDLASA
jgi:hypothetical protein